MLPSAEENDRDLRDVTGSGGGYLYRYRDLVGERAEWVRQIISESKLFFASPSSFNDPFDCKARFRGDLGPAEFRSRADDLMRSRGMDRKQRRKALRSAPRPKELAKRVAAGMQDKLDRMGILSLSSTHENILMWSHYAFGHRGVCLQFRVSTDPDYLGAALPVTYSRELLTPTLFGKDHRERVEAILLTKAVDWSYEREWRVLRPNGAGVDQFPPALLTSIILGASISPADRALVAGWVEARAGSLDTYQATRDPDQYGLRFEHVAPK